jgi:hypothetical protein
MIQFCLMCQYLANVITAAAAVLSRREGKSYNVCLGQAKPNHIGPLPRTFSRLCLLRRLQTRRTAARAGRSKNLKNGIHYCEIVTVSYRQDL